MQFMSDEIIKSIKKIERESRHNQTFTRNTYKQDEDELDTSRLRLSYRT